MEPWTVAEIVQAVNGRLTASGDQARMRSAVVTGVSTDSRSIGKGQIFFAIPGKKFDGADFAKDAVKRSGTPAVVHRPIEGVPAVLVDDALKALGELAKTYRKKLGKKTIAITGTNGKTTTKEMAASVLGLKYRVHRNKGNMNNLIGLPLSVMDMSKDDEVAVFEMGMSERGEISRMCEITEPVLGVLTNVGPCHLESLGCIEEVAKAKSELVDYLDKGKEVILNFDDPLVREMAGKARAKVTGFGMDSPAPIRAGNAKEENWQISFTLESNGRFEVPVPGKFNIYNALAAIAVGMSFGVAPEEARTALARFVPEKRRMARIDARGVTIIDDSYNANPASVMCALEVLSGMKAGRKIVVLGDMLELGSEAVEMHRKIGRAIKQSGIDVLFAYGKDVKYSAEAARKSGLADVREFQDKPELVRVLRGLLKEGDVVLVKGSRGMAMDEVVQGLIGEEFGA